MEQPFGALKGLEHVPVGRVKRNFLAHSALPPTHTRPLTLTAHGEQSQNWTEKKQGRTEKRLVGAKPPSQH